MSSDLVNILWAVVFVMIGCTLGSLLVFASASILPRFLDKITPNIDEEKELVRGNMAVAEYFGRVVAATILGISIVIAASVLGGIISALH